MGNRDIYATRALAAYEGRYPLTKAVTGVQSTTGVITCWTPASSTAKWRLKGGSISGVVRVVLQATIAGGFFALYEETANTIVQIIASVAKVGAVAGSQFPGPQTVTTFAPDATTPVYTATRNFEFDFDGPGIVASTANKKLLLGYFTPAGALATIGSSGSIQWSGAVWGDEIVA